MGSAFEPIRTATAVMSPVRRLGVVAALAAAGIAATLTGVSPAQAAPVASSCLTGLDGPRGSFVICTKGSGAYRSWTQCRGGIWPHNWYMRYGNWQTPSSGNKSISACHWGDTRYSYGMELS